MVLFVLPVFEWLTLNSTKMSTLSCFLVLAQYDCVMLCADTAAACEAKMRSAFQKAEVYKPCILLLRNFQLLGQLRDGSEMDARVLAVLCQLIEKAPSR